MVHWPEFTTLHQGMPDRVQHPQGEPATEALAARRHDHPEVCTTSIYLTPPGQDLESLERMFSPSTQVRICVCLHRIGAILNPSPVVEALLFVLDGFFT